MKQILNILLLFVILTTGPLASQKQAYNWYMGRNCILNFDTDDFEPENILIEERNDCTNSNNIKSTISNKEGNLILITDGQFVYNKFFRRVNDNSFGGGFLWLQKAIFIPKPGSDSLVYLFVSSGEDFYHGLRYHLIDIKANNDSADFVKKFVHMGQSFSTKIAATMHENGKDVWVVVHEWNSNTFRAFLIDEEPEDSIDTFVWSTVGQVFSGEVDYDRGFMKISPDGSKLAYHYVSWYPEACTMLFDFNNRTGKVSNPIRFGRERYDTPNYLEFSPDGSKLYSIEPYKNLPMNSIVQYDANAIDSASFVESRKVIAKGDSLSAYWGTLQLAPNGKIYFDFWNGNISLSSTNLLGSITHPNAEGRNCTVVDSSHKLTFNISYPFVQNFISTYFWDSCDAPSFSYPFFEYTDGLIINGTARQEGNVIRLTDNSRFQSGAIWYERKVPVASSFEVTYSFLMSGGTNGNSEDGSEPGADGLTLVIKNSEDTVGTVGGGIGYSSINNALAIEIDLYNNKDNNDGSGNHIAVQSSKGLISSLHNPEFTIAKSEIPLIIKSDSTVYYCKIIHNSVSKVLSIFIDTTENFSIPIIEIDSFDIRKYIDLENEKFATMGLTSSTGDAAQVHDVISWRFCSKTHLNKIITDIDEENLTREFEDNLMISPNPATDFVNIQIPLDGYNDVEFFNVMGIRVKSFKLDGGEHKIDISGLSPGVYFVKVGSIVSKFIKI